MQDSCKVKPHWNVVNGAVKGALAGISLPNFLQRAGRGRAASGRSI